MHRRTQLDVPFLWNFNSIFRRDHQKNSYERRVYESVDEELILGYVPKNDEKNNLVHKDLIEISERERNSSSYKQHLWSREIQ